MSEQRDEGVRSIRIEDEMRTSYLDYAMSVIVARALPDVRDGLKPVHRRILYTMGEMGLSGGSAYRKCAAIVGEVMGKYHPHGDGALYDALVRLAQDFSMRHPLVDGQGNFGSVDGDSAAAMRYTEARLTAIASEMLADIDHETVDFTPNYDGTQKEPSVLPSRLPNLLVNGSSGIAVGMATNIPPHNLGEVADAAIALVENPDLTAEELCAFVQAPDFPTGGVLYRYDQIKNPLTGAVERVDAVRQMYAHGRGRIVVEGSTHFEEAARGDRTAIIITELPYQVNKATLVEKIADLVKEERLDGIADLRDESDRDGMRIYVEVKRDANPHKVLNRLLKLTPLRSAFSLNMLALVNGQPQTLSLKSVIQHHIEHRRIIVRRRTEFELKKARERAHILEGLKIALDNLDAVIKTIRAAADVDVARTQLMEKFKLSELQAQAILDMRLARLAALERKKIEEEYLEVIQLIAELEDILGKPARISKIIAAEYAKLKEKFGDARRTRIANDATREMSDEDLIADEDVVITISGRGYIKRQPLATYRQQHRGGKGVIGMTTREEDAVATLLVANTHDFALFFTNRGRCFSAKVHEIPDATRQNKGIPIVNLPGVQVEAGETPVATVILNNFNAGSYLAFATKRGIIKKTALEQFEKVRSSGIIAITLDKGDELAQVITTSGQDDLILATRQGRMCRFHEREARPMGRTAGGVIGIRLARQGDFVVAMAVADPSAELLVLTETGHGKRVPTDAFARKHRGTQGVRLIPLEGRKTGPVVAVRQVSEADEEIILISAEGQVVRTKLESVATRKDGSAQGVRVMTLREGDKVAGIAAFRTGLAKRDGAEENSGARERVPAKRTPKAAPKAVKRATSPTKSTAKVAPKSPAKPAAKGKPAVKGKPAAKGKPAVKKRSGR
jgi:DNA gyrase subunit A